MKARPVTIARDPDLKYHRRMVSDFVFDYFHGLGDVMPGQADRYETIIQSTV